MTVYKQIKRTQMSQKNPSFDTFPPVSQYRDKFISI